MVRADIMQGIVPAVVKRPVGNQPGLASREQPGRRRANLRGFERATPNAELAQTPWESATVLCPVSIRLTREYKRRGVDRRRTGGREPVLRLSVQIQRDLQIVANHRNVIPKSLLKGRGNSAKMCGQRVRYLVRSRLEVHLVVAGLAKDTHVLPVGHVAIEQHPELNRKAGAKIQNRRCWNRRVRGSIEVVDPSLRRRRQAWQGLPVRHGSEDHQANKYLNATPIVHESAPSVFR